VATGATVTKMRVKERRLREKCSVDMEIKVTDEQKSVVSRKKKAERRASLYTDKSVRDNKKKFTNMNEAYGRR